MSYHKLNLLLLSLLIMFGAWSMPSVSLAVVRSIHLDLGINTQPTTATGWNHLTGAAGAKPVNVLNLRDSTGALAGITLTPSWSAMDDDTGIALAQANYDGPYPEELAGIPQSALRDNIYVRDGQTFTMTLTNLPANTRYNFLFYGAAGNTGDYSLWTVTGSNTGTDSIANLIMNSTDVATVIGTIPDAQQRIVVRFEGRRPNGAVQNPGINNDGLGRFNYMRILQHSLINGDFDANGVVNATDYMAWRNDFGLLAHVTGSDGNYNGIVDASDYVVWRKAMSTSGGAAASSSAQSLAVPEPHAALLLAASIFSVCGLRVRDRGRSRR
ncbi:MAG TPA: hypothetical protein VGK58_18130 [Lacipirellulaceae bacterium]